VKAGQKRGKTSTQQHRIETNFFPGQVKGEESQGKKPREGVAQHRSAIARTKTRNGTESAMLPAFLA